MSLGRLAIIVGHDAHRPGALAVSPLSVHEYFYNYDIAHLICDARDPMVECRMFLRTPGQVANAYEEANAFGAKRPSCMVELHFNAFVNSDVKGTETLYDAGGDAWAQVVHGHVCRVFNREGRENRGIKKLSPGDRGATNLSLTEAPAVILEPFFGSNKDDASQAAVKKVEYAQCILTAARRFLSP